MSRYIGTLDEVTVKLIEKRVVYGYDRMVCGYFIQVFNAEDECVVDKDSFFHGLTGVQLREMLVGEGVVIPEAHEQAMMLDMPF